MDRKKLEEAARLIIEAVGDDPGREGLLETPKRFADMMEEQFKYCSTFPMTKSPANSTRPSNHRKATWSS